LSGDIDQNDGDDPFTRIFNSDNLMVGLNIDSTTLIDGITFKAGGQTHTVGSDLGGGLILNAASPIIRNCTFIDNVAISGGAISITDSSPVISNPRSYIEVLSVNRLSKKSRTI